MQGGYLVHLIIGIYVIHEVKLTISIDHSPFCSKI